MVTEKDDILLDLDALAPPKVQVKFNGKTIKIVPPDLPAYAKIIALSEEMKKDKSNFTAVTVTYQKMETLVKELIPEVKEDTLNFAQISSLFKLLSEIGAPSDKAIAKLKAQGINLKPSKQSPKVSAS